ncbi:MAG: macro domain-containing protein [Acidaminococcaceae bacterium]|nr:macro domain-containing protein [Acidaminococcaceae bacterium]MBO6182432.1 macro domain-containing protein [Acidaminococcaceae bacterium]MBP3265194.1 macro domain-containing protein [Acidaminococcaceae bacterium]MBQ5345321.1 macro domain-containing protein [Acidaminococcaceae bacterium]
MSVTFIRGDITKLQADAIVNAANNELRGGGGVDGAIHKAAGSELYAYCKTLGGCPTGGAKISPGFNLPAKYIIHTVGPVWRGGAFHEKTLLTSCYLRSLELAHKHGCKTVAFPLISAGAYGYPYNDALQIAYDTCNLFLKETKADIDIFIVLYQGSPNVRRHTNRTAFELPDTAVFKRVAAYIRENYHFNAEEAKTTEADSPEDGVLDSSRFGFSKSEIRFQIASKPPTQAKRNIAAKKAKKQFTDFEEGLDFSCDMGSASAMADSLPAPAKEKKLLSKRRFQMASGDLAGPWMLDRENLSVEETFTQMLLRFMEEKHMTPPELYNNACLDRKLFSKIQSNIDYQPKKYTAVRLALALQLSPEETDALLETAGFALSRSKITDLVISYCIANNKRAVWEVNGILEDWGLATI